jgi:peptide/nickel transport system substrate-binding protein
VGALAATGGLLAAQEVGAAPLAHPLRQDDATPEVTGEPGGELVYALTNTLDTLDPNITTFSDSLRIARHLFDPLVEQPAAGEFIPALATSWEVNDTADVYTFELRDDVTFHDGTPFDAEAVKFTFDRIIDPELQSQIAFSLLGPYESSDATSPTSITVNFSSPYAPFLNSVSQPPLFTVSPPAVEAAGADFGLAPVGTGPFMFDSYEVDAQVRILRNPDYNWAAESFGHEGPAYLDAITWRIISEPGTRLAALQSGEVHMIQDVPTQDYPTVTGDSTLELLEAVMTGSGWSMMMNVTRAPMDDVLVRQALSWGVDREGLILSIWQGAYQVSCSPLTSVTFAYDPATCDIYGYDPERAAALLDEAGWALGGDGIRSKDGQPLRIECYYRSDNANFTALATFLQAMYQPLGITFEPVGLAQAGYFDAVRTGQHHVQFWWGPATDPDGVFRVFFHSSNADGGTNRNRYVNPEVDAMIDEAAGTVDRAARAELYSALQIRVLEEAIMAFFSEPTSAYAFRPEQVRNVSLDFSSIYPLFYDTTLVG